MTILVGSSLPRGRGRPRKFATDDAAARKRASRAAKKRQEEIAALQQEQKIDDKTNGGSLLLTEADKGKGRISTGGFTTALIDQVTAARQRDGVSNEDIKAEAGGSGRKVTPEGYGRDDEGENDQSPMGWKKPLGNNPSQKTNRKQAYIVCMIRGEDGKAHSQVDGPCRTFVVLEESHGKGKPKTRRIVPGVPAEPQGERWLLPLPAHREGGKWILACGCFRSARVNPPRIIVTSNLDEAEEAPLTEEDKNQLHTDALRRKWLSESFNREVNTASNS